MTIWLWISMSLCTQGKAREKRNYAVNMQSSTTRLLVYVEIVSTHNKDLFSHSRKFAIENEKSSVASLLSYKQRKEEKFSQDKCAVKKKCVSCVVSEKIKRGKCHDSRPIRRTEQTNENLKNKY